MSQLATKVSLNRNDRSDEVEQLVDLFAQHYFMLQLPQLLDPIVLIGRYDTRRR
jgi:hypothetical protein